MNWATSMKSHNNLIEKITSKENMLLAFDRTALAKRMTYGYLEFKEFKTLNIEALAKELLEGTYTIGEYKQFYVFEPKQRLISALEFKDRLAQHALVAVIGEIFEAMFLPNTFACRTGMGTHAGVKYIQSELRRSPKPLYYLKTDYRKFFPSVDHDILKAMIKRKIKCEKTCLIIDQLLFSQGIGIPIGSLTSQLFANIYGSKVDSFIHHELKHRRWARYMDDVVILGDDPERLRNDFYRIEEFSKENLKLSISRWQCSSVKRGINFLGYRIWNTHKLIRKDSVLRAKHKIQCFIENNEIINLTKFLASWRGHVGWADTHNLITYLDNKYDYANY